MKDQSKTDKIHYYFLERYNDAFIDELKEFFAPGGAQLLTFLVEFCLFYFRIR